MSTSNTTLDARMLSVAIRADASVEIGSGHVMRCAALATALRARGAAVVFVCRGEPGDLLAWLDSAGFAVRRLAPSVAGWEEDAAATRAALAGINPDWLIVDHYQLDARWEQSMRPAAGSIMAIDDLADRPHDCDLLLDQNLYLDSAARYAGRVPAGCTRLLGPGYALLRPQFRSARAHVRTRASEVGRVLLAFGGSDAGNETAKALRAIRLLDRPGVQIDVVVGAANPHRAMLNKYCHALHGVALHCQVDDMARLMLRADLCIGAGGSTSWERCCVGLPTLAVAIAANQVEAARTLDQLGYVRFLGSADRVSEQEIAQALAQAMDDGAALQAMAQHGMKLVDGEGASRVAAILAARFHAGAIQ
jgi:UDP-2,4-diacetamido-2,4,6-trideoxy-beta-L-altropyranose hydrolase